jgi:HMG (high mobility group) box
MAPTTGSERAETTVGGLIELFKPCYELAGLSFANLAREIGLQWKCLKPADKHRWESQAAAATQEYNERMELYRRTDAYQKY